MPDTEAFDRASQPPRITSSARSARSTTALRAGAERAERARVPGARSALAGERAEEAQAHRQGSHGGDDPAARAPPPPDAAPRLRLPMSPSRERAGFRWPLPPHTLPVIARMVDVSAKAETVREAVAQVTLKMQAGHPVRRARRPDGQGRRARRGADRRHHGGQAHARPDPALPSTAHHRRDVTLRPRPPPLHDHREARVRTVDKTGVEMEALTAAAVAGLTVYDMVKAVDRGVVLTGLCLLHKSGGKSGTWRGAGRAGSGRVA